MPEVVQLEIENGNAAEPKGCCKKRKGKKEPKPDIPEVSITTILRTAPGSYWLMILGTLCAMINGVTLPGFSIVFGSLFDVFFNAGMDPDVRSWEISKMAIIFVGIGLGTFLMTYLSNTLWIIVAERVGKKLRLRFITAVLNQDAAFYDKTQSGVLVSRLSADVILIQTGIEKLSNAIYNASQVLAGVIVAFIYGWKMTLVMLAMSPLMVLSGFLESSIISGKAKDAQHANAKANDIASEAFSGFKTVYSFVSERRMINKYKNNLKKAYGIGIKRAHFTGSGSGFVYLFMFAVYGLGFWYGGQLVMSGESTPGDILVVFFSIIMGAMGLGQAASIMPDIAKSKGAGAVLFDVISCPPGININEGNGKTLPSLKGTIQFKNVKFAYPTRETVTVMDKFNLKIKSGTTVALVGPSGGGKSTTVQLIERYYDALEGVLTIDGVDVREFDLRWFRSHVGLVSQEPILFAGTIAENIRFGKEDATDDEVYAAAKAANAHNFITELAHGYETQVGERGSSLSGGQKQRVAIARAILKNPAILLLDEATSALDAESEHLVQDALDRLMKGRTTVVIAHRLTTVRDADKICVIKKGTVIEEGTHAELIELGGFYASLVSRQLSSDEAALELENGDAAAETNKGAEDNKAAKDKKKSTSHKKKKSSTKQ